MSNVMLVMTAALAVELLLVLLGVLLFAWIKNRAARSRDIKAMRVLVARIKKSMDERDAEIEGFLADGMGLSGDALQQTRVAIRRAELELLKRFASVYKKRDAGAAAQFDIDLVAGLAPYLALRSMAQGVAIEQAPADPSEIEALRAQNVRLSEELSVTMETMARMLNEYSSMFAGGAPGEAVPMEELVGVDGDTGDAAEGSDDATGATSSQVVDDDIEVDVDIGDVPRAVELDTSGVGEETAGLEPGPDGSDTQGPDPVAAEDYRQDDIDALFAADAQQDLMNATEQEVPTTAEESDAGEAEEDVVNASAEPEPVSPGQGVVLPDRGETVQAAMDTQSVDADQAQAEIEEADLPDDYLDEAMEPDRSSRPEAIAQPADDQTAADAGSAAAVSGEDVDVAVDPGQTERPSAVEPVEAAGPDSGDAPRVGDPAVSSQQAMDDSGDALADAEQDIPAEVTAGPPEDAQEVDAGPAHAVAMEAVDAIKDPSTTGFFDTPDTGEDALDAGDEAAADNPEALSQQAMDDPGPSVADTEQQGAVAEVEAAPVAAALDVEATDDLDHMTSLFDTGETEVVAFDDQDDFDAGMAVDEDGLFDPVEPESLARAETEVDEVLGDIDALFDAVDEPRKTQSGQ